MLYIKYDNETGKLIVTDCLRQLLDTMKPYEWYYQVLKRYHIPIECFSDVTTLYEVFDRAKLRRYYLCGPLPCCTGGTGGTGYGTGRGTGGSGGTGGT